jgi:predicted RNA binding protein YcfA (HicA-like mRNA interferase family)
MHRINVVRPKDLVRALVRLGFTETRQRGSHKIMHHIDGRRAVIPMHNKELPRGTLMGILRDIGLDASELTN